VAVVTRPLWFLTVLDRTVLRGTHDLMRVLQQAGGRGDPSQANPAPRGTDNNSAPVVRAAAQLETQAKT
jgi:hypothetical protein